MNSEDVARLSHSVCILRNRPKLGLVAAWGRAGCNKHSLGLVTGLQDARPTDPAFAILFGKHVRVDDEEM
jgi:hypothetical protein